MTLPNWENDEATRRVASDLAGAAVVQHLDAGRDVVMAQYFGRLGYIVLLEDLAREHDATFVEVILATSAALAIDRFRARRRAMNERGERHPERDIADTDVEAFILDAVDRLTRLPTARPASRIVPVALDTTEDEIYRRLLSVLGEKARLSTALVVASGAVASAGVHRAGARDVCDFRPVDLLVESPPAPARGHVCASGGVVAKHAKGCGCGRSRHGESGLFGGESSRANSAERPGGPGDPV